MLGGIAVCRSIFLGVPAFDPSGLAWVENVGRPRIIAHAVGHATTVWNIDLEPLPVTCPIPEAPGVCMAPLHLQSAAVAETIVCIVAQDEVLT